MEEKDIKRIMYLHDLLEMCHFNIFWAEIDDYKDLVAGIKDFNDSIRKYICHVIKAS
ncbi:hypothetical protein Anas_12998 [Armadillidium nasatum]|uniref:CSN8/PSMD8/EIF3K domain-containing protein n=1 Tax=Armadillidium nasatum TaxID=96803 RepID=A0A5N5T353_9CRUS|nr:hypothetical protein Anas_12998 [Armadillidium nasatum]